MRVQVTTIPSHPDAEADTTKYGHVGACMKMLGHPGGLWMRNHASGLPCNPDTVMLRCEAQKCPRMSADRCGGAGIG